MKSNKFDFENFENQYNLFRKGDKIGEEIRLWIAQYRDSDIKPNQKLIIKLIRHLSEYPLFVEIGTNENLRAQKESDLISTGTDPFDAAQRTSYILSSDLDADKLHFFGRWYFYDSKLTVSQNIFHHVYRIFRNLLLVNSIFCEAEISEFINQYEEKNPFCFNTRV